MKTDKQFIDEIYKKYDEYQKEEKIKRQKVMKRIINIAAVFVVALSSVVVFSQKKTPKVLQEMKKEDVAKIDLETVGNFENFYNIIKSKNSTNGETKYSFNLQESITDVAKSDMLETRSNTNIQVENVDEGDIVKTDDKYIYYLSKQRLIIINAENAETSGKIAEINFKEENFYPIEIYVQNNKLALIGNIAYNENLKMSTEMQDISEAPKSKTGIIIYDITDRSNPKEIRNVMLEGSYITSMSRMIDENIYFAVSENIYGYDISCKSIEELNENDYMPKYTDTAISNEEKCISYDKIYNLDETEDANYLILVGININGDNEADIQTFLGAGTYLYSSEKNMYIATNEVEYDENYKVINTKTKLMKFELNNGKIIYKAKGKVEGSVNNQFSMDENGDNFRIATTIGEIWSNQNTSNNLYVLNDKLEEIGKIEGLAEGEKIYSVRYMGSKAYVVTFKQTDPFWVIDLSDATNPQILGEVKLPGYSVYLHPYDEKHIIGFGYDTKENGTRVTNNGLKLVMFDVSDFTNPQVLFQIAVGDSKYTYSELLYNHKSAIFSKEKGIMAFPINSSSGLKTNSRAVIYKIDLENGFSLQGEIGTISNNYEEEVRRIVFVNGNYYTLSYSQVRVADMDSLNVFKIIDI